MMLALFLISTLRLCILLFRLEENGKENGKEEKPDTRGSTSRIIRFG